MFGESELLLDPNYFEALASNLPRNVGVNTRIKYGRSDNELTRYRYDVTLHVEPVSEISLTVLKTLRWDSEVANIEDLQMLLLSKQLRRIRVTGIPNWRLTRELAVRQRLETGSEIAQLQYLLHSIESTGVNFELFQSLGDAAGYRVDATWSRDGVSGQLDVIFTDMNYLAEIEPIGLYLSGSTDFGRLNSYANVPHIEDTIAELVRLLRAYLSEDIAGVHGSECLCDTGEPAAHSEWET